MKKILAMLLVLAMCLVPVAAFAEGTNTAAATAEATASPEATPATTTVPGETVEPETTKDPLLPDYTTLTVGSTTELTGRFFTDMWGNNTSDIDVRTMLHGYNTIVWTDESMYAIDESVTSGSVATQDAAGNHTYLFVLRDDLYYSDGTQITAADYVFSVLLQSAKQISELGGSAFSMSYLDGFEAFHSGESEAFAGVRLIGQYQFSLTIKAEYLPYFYELLMVSVNPYPISVIAPGCEVADDGAGAYIRNIDQTIEEPLFTAELLRETILDPETGYLTHPAVTSGPYVLTDYDEETRVATFAINEYYKGDYNGQRPSIRNVIFKHVSNATMLDELRDGTVDLINKVTDGAKVTDGMQLVNDELARVVNYPRMGFAFLSFACEDGPASSAAVRKAISYCMDKDALVEQFTMNYGTSVYGYYGIGQWMVLMINGTMENEAATPDEAARWAALTLDELETYALDVEAAKALLIEDGWTLNEKGEPFVEGEDEVRYKDVDGELQSLTIKWAKTTESGMGDMIESMLADNLKGVGVALEITEMSYAEMTTHYYRETDREYDMFNLATNFTTAFDPYPVYAIYDEYQGSYNVTGLRDEDLMYLALDMRTTESGDLLTYCEKWLAFQAKWNELLPAVPLYTNVYFDFYGEKLQDYAVNVYSSWASAILYAYLGLPVEEEEGEIAPAETAEGSVVIIG